MAQIDSNATLEQIAQMEREFARKRQLAEMKRAAEIARLSDERAFVDEYETTWTYVIVDGCFVRIISCETTEELLVVPDQMDNLPVREIGPEALSSLPFTREIRCCDSIESIGAYAFRSCENMRRLFLPSSTPSFFGSWVAKCPNLEELILPDATETLTQELFMYPAVRSLSIGSRAQFVEPGAFGKSRLERVSVDERNTHLKTDGTCLYTADGLTLVALARPVACYEIEPGCHHIAKKAFAGFEALRQVILPEGLESIDDLAFARSGVTAIEFPASLATVGNKAFLGCKALESARLNEGLRSIGDRAFANTALQSLRIPSTTDDLGNAICDKSSVCFSNDAATFSIDPTNPLYSLDEQGCLYRYDEDGTHLAEMLDPFIKKYEIRPGTIAIDDKAFAFHGAIEEIVLPEGLTRIGAGAFRVCRKLRRISIPDSLESIGTEAFIDSALEHFRIPLALADIGARALVTDGAHHEGPKPALQSIEVTPNHPLFYIHTGMLCRRGNASDSVVIFTSSCESVEFPESIVEVEDYAFNNAFGIHDLHLNARLRTIGACGLSVMSQIRNVRIDVAKPIEGISSFTLRFPSSSHSVHGFLLALGGLGHLHMPDIMAQYDSFIAGARNYHAPANSDNASAYEQVKLIIARLESSVLLTEPNRRRYHAVLDDNIEEICRDIARHDDRVTMGKLADLGALNAENLERVIEAVGRLQDASMTGYLLEMKRLRFSQRIIDFDL